MSKFRYVMKKEFKTSKPFGQEDFESLINNVFVCDSCKQARRAKAAGDDDQYVQHKGELPLVFWLGYNSKGSRLKERQQPTQYYYIDIDHPRENPRTIFDSICSMLTEDGSEAVRRGVLHEAGIRIVMETPSGGLRIIARAVESFHSVIDHIKWFAERFGLGRYGDVDTVVHDLSRGSFLTCAEWLIYYDATIWTEDIDFAPIQKMNTSGSGGAKAPEAPGGTEAAQSQNAATVPVPTEAQRNLTFNGKKLSEIAAEWVAEQGGVPEEGLRHAFYNELIKNFRNLCDNNPVQVFAVLPLCDGTEEKRWSQCTSICRSNTTTKIPKDFFFWLKRKGYYKSRKDQPMIDFLDSEPSQRQPMPKLPPVFREFCAICPPDFVYPTIVGLLPVMGTLSSYVRADYIDNEEQSPTFFSCIWAPPGCGKSFAKRLVSKLMTKIKLRDEINNIREQLWLIDTRTKAGDEKGIDLPHVMVRVMPAINSMPEFLEKMRDNRGYHMFTLAEEVDTFKKGSSSGGTDKSDLFRTAWDNSEYGQSFKSAATFKGMVKVYYNILLTGTPGAVKKYYSNVEDGMVTRISICEIENQMFAKFQPWKKFNAQQEEVINKYIERCDKNTYREPVDYTLDDVHLYDNNSKNYDNNIKWRFNLREKTVVDMSWIFPTIQEWLERKRLEASLELNMAADTFRRRTGVKGFRVALMCMTLWNKVGKKEKQTIIDFVKWFMDRDLEESLKMFGQKYNELQNSVVTEVNHHQSLFESLPEEFTKNDVIAQCLKQGVHSKVKVILWRWKQDKAIVKVNNELYKKVKQ